MNVNSFLVMVSTLLIISISCIINVSYCLYWPPPRPRPPLTPLRSILTRSVPFLVPQIPPPIHFHPLKSHFDGRVSVGQQWGCISGQQSAVVSGQVGVLLVITRLEIDPNRSNRQNFLTQKLEVALLPDPTRTQKFGAWPDTTLFLNWKYFKSIIFRFWSTHLE